MPEDFPFLLPTDKARPVKSIRPCEHVCCVASPERAAESVFFPYVLHGHNCGQKVMLVANSPLLSLLSSKMKEQGLDLLAWQESGQLAIVAPADFYRPNGHFERDVVEKNISEAVADARDEGYDHLYWAGDSSWIGTTKGAFGSFRGYEACLTEIAQKEDVTFLCYYNPATVQTDNLAGIVRVHPFIAADGKIYRNKAFLPTADFLAAEKSRSRVKKWLAGMKKPGMADRLGNQKTELPEIFESMSEMVMLYDSDLNVQWANEAALARVDGELEDLLNRKCYSVWQNRNKPCEKCPVRDAIKTGESQTGEKSLANRTYFLRAHPMLKPDGNVAGVVEYALEITEQKKAQRKLRRERYFRRALIEESPAFYVAISADGKILTMNESMRRQFGYEEEKVRGRDYIKTFVPEEDREKLEEVFERIVQEGDSVVTVNRVKSRDGHRSIVKWHGTPVFDDNGDLEFFFGVGLDVTETRLAERALGSSLEQLRGVLKQTVEALASTVEIRDPYTADHQRRVAQLACAIAQKMGFSLDRIEGINVAATVHDLGKLQVPAAILGKPTELDESEYALVKTHSDVGYQMLDPVDFPWPVAQVIRQHHERMDGSGYPRGIKGHEMLPEARILAVADVVEAMSSHRPYRPAKGVDKALEVIFEGEGNLFDDEAVEACIAIFRSGEFKFRD
ncbi:MAG: HD domain-containing phosphohydrolase [Candidatus Brocadiia bacterium]